MKHAKFASLMLISFFLVSILALGIQVKPGHALPSGETLTPIFVDDFEGATYTVNWQDNVGSGSTNDLAEISTSQHHGGSQSVYLKAEGDGSLGGDLHLTNSSSFPSFTQSYIYFSAWIYIDRIDNFSGVFNFQQMFMASDVYSNGSWYWGDLFGHLTNLPVQVGVWTHLEADYYLDAHGYVKLYVDGVKLSEMLGVDLSSMTSLDVLTGGLIMFLQTQDVTSGVVNSAFVDDYGWYEYTKQPDLYWFNFTAEDANANPISMSEFTLSWWNGSDPMTYTLGESTLYAGTYDLSLFWKQIDLLGGMTTPIDTATYGNMTTDFGSLPFLPWNSGYIYINDSGAAATINTQTSQSLNITVSSASGAYNTTVSGFSSSPAVVQVNGTDVSFDYNATEETVTVTSNSSDTSIIYINQNTPASDVYWFNFTFEDQNSNPIPSNVFTYTWEYDTNGSSLTYTLGEATLYSGAYDVWVYWQGVEVSSGAVYLDTATYGNTTIDFGAMGFQPWLNGYIYVNDWGATITINSQDDSQLNYTVAGATGNFTTVVSVYPKEPSDVRLNGTATDYTYSSGQETVSINGTDPNDTFYIKPATTGGGGEGGGGGSGGGSWSTPIVNAAQSLIDAIKSIPPMGIYAILGVLGLIAFAGMTNKKQKKAPSRSTRERK